MSATCQAITYVITREHDRWVGRCPTGEVEGVAVSDSLSRLERELAETHAWAWPADTPAVEFVFDLPEELAHLVATYKETRALADRYNERALELARQTAATLTNQMSEPDTARIMGLSKQRVHQLKIGA